MPLDTTAPGLDALLLATVLQLELTDRDLRVGDKRYQFVPKHLQRPASRMRQLMETARIYPQGSRVVLSRFSSGPFRAIIAVKENGNGNKIHRRVST